MFVISSYFLYVPIELRFGGTTEVSAGYFLIWFLVFYLAWTLFEIPHLAWGSELATSSQERNKIYSMRALSTGCGVMFFYLVPLLPFFSGNSFTPKTLEWAAMAAGCLMLPALYFCVKKTPDGSHMPSMQGRETDLRTLHTEIFANKPFLLFIAAYSLYFMGAAGMSFTLIFIFIDVYLRLGEHFAVLSLIGICAGLLTLSFWYRLANHIDKRFTWVLGVLFYIAGVFGLGFLNPGETDVMALAVVMVFIYIASIALAALSPSLLADIIDYSVWKFDKDRAATYFSIYTLVSKTSMAIGGSISLALAAWYNFDPTSITQTKHAEFGLRLSACWLPVLLMGMSIPIMMLVPINMRRHWIVRQRLDSRVEKAPSLGACHIKENITGGLKTQPS